MQHPSLRRLLIGIGGGSTNQPLRQNKKASLDHFARCGLFDDRNEQYSLEGGGDRIISNDGVMGCNLLPSSGWGGGIMASMASASSAQLPAWAIVLASNETN